MNQHTPGVLAELLRQAGAVIGGQYVGRPAPIAGPGATGIQVQNLATSGDPAEITAAFYEQYDPYDPGQLFSQQPAAAHRERRTAAPGAAANIYLPLSDLPFPTSYSALIDGAGASLAAIYRADWPSTGGVLAIVQDGQNGTELLSAYNAVPRDQAAERVAVPLFRNDHSAYHLTTGIQIMNVGVEPALGTRITFRSTDPDGGSTEIPCGAACVVDIPAGGSHTFWPGDPALGIPPGSFGAAVVESPRPVAVIVNDYPLTGAVDAATYNAIPME